MISNLIALLAGALLPLAFAPFNVYGLAFISPAILLFLWMNASPRKAFLQGWLYGLGFFGVGTSWIFISINTYGNTPFLISVLITALFTMAMALFPAVQGGLFRRLFSQTRLPIVCLCAFPAMWVLFEILREFLLTGFPWLYLGYSQITTPLSGLGPLFGVYGISFACATIAGALVILATQHNSTAKTLSTLVILSIVGFGWVIENKLWTKPLKAPLKVSSVQGNIAQPLKWNTNYLRNILSTYQQLVALHWDSQLIVLPEAAVPALPSEVPAYIDNLAYQAKQHNSAVIFGAPTYHDDEYFNSLLLIGTAKGIYEKHHLVPFGEYIPMKTLFSGVMKYFNVPMSDFSPGPQYQNTLDVAGIKIAPYLCYEIAFPSEVLATIKDKNLIVTISDDSWFGNSIALDQHLQIAQMRSLETGRPQVLSTNTGITAFINPLGKIIEAAPINQTVVITEMVNPTQGKTPFMIWEEYPLLIGIGLMLLLSFLL